jgi:hypothetical protein
MSNVKKMVTMFPSIALKWFVKQLIEEYGVFERESDIPYLWTIELGLHDQKILLSHACDAEEYAYYLSDAIRLAAGLNEYDDLMQSWLDAACLEVHQERMRGDHVTTYDRREAETPWALNW